MIDVPRLRMRLPAVLPMAILQNAAAVSAAALATAGLGYVFWWLAARAFPPAAIGFAAAVTSAMTLLGTLGVLGLGTLLIAEVGRNPARAGGLVALAMGCAALAAAGLGLAFAALTPRISPDLATLATPIPMALFAVGVGLTAAAIVLDQALVGLLRGGVQLWRNVLFGASRLVGLGVVWLALRGAPGDGLAIIATWVAANLVSMLPLGQIARPRRWSLSLVRGRPGPGALGWNWPVVRQRLGAAVGHHALNVGLQLPALSLPILVTVALSATDDAYFYVAWMLAGVAFLGSSALTLALYAVAVREPRHVARYTRVTLGLGLGCGLLAMLGVFTLADPLLGAFFGASYAERTGPVLRLLIVAACPLVVIDHFVALCRIQGRPLVAARLVIPGAVVQLAVAALGARVGGLGELSLGWVLGVTVEAALMLPLVIRVVAPRSRRVQGGSIA
jgi:O-antigen/teichoic acid export membrane protein